MSKHADIPGNPSDCEPEKETDLEDCVDELMDNRKSAELESLGDENEHNILCEAKAKENGIIFDNLLLLQAKKSDSETDKLIYYCIRKYAVDNKLIDSNRFKVNLNPNNVDVSGFDCEHFMNGIAEGNAKDLATSLRREGLSTKIIECAVDKFSQTSFNGILTVIFTVSEIDVSLFPEITETIQKERKNFIEVMRQIDNSTKKCIREA